MQGPSGCFPVWDVVLDGYMGKEKGLGPNEKGLYSESTEP